MALRMGIIGAGGIAGAHARAAGQVSGVDLVALCDVSEAALQRLGDQAEVAALYTDLERMLEQENLDTLSVCTWGNSHAEVALRAAESGKVRAILVEKPISSTAAECARMVEAAAANGVLLAEAFKFRHHPMHLKLKELVDAGAVGKVRSVRSTFATNVPAEQIRKELNWRWDPERGGGAVYDLACYCIHHARFIYGAEPQTVFAVCRRGPTGIDEETTILLEFSGGGTAEIAVGFTFFATQYVEVHGTGGRLRAERAWNNENQPTAIDAEFAGGSARFDFAPVYQFALQLQHLRDCLERGGEYRISPQNSLGQMRVIDAVFASMERGAPVRPGG